jgi:CRISPR-associated protein Cmr6
MSKSNETNLGWLFYKDYYKDYYNVPEAVAANDRTYASVLPTTVEARNKKAHDAVIEAFFDKKNQEITQYRIVDNNHLDLGFAQKVDLKLIAPGMVSGIGIAHAAEEVGEFKLGFEFDHTTGQPILPGSSVKGAARSVFPSKTLEAVVTAKTTLEREYLYYMAQQKEAYFKTIFGFDNDREILKTEYRIFENIELKDNQIGYYKKSFDEREYFFYEIKKEEKGKLHHLPSKKQPAFFDAYFKASNKPLLGHDFITPHKQKDRTKREMDQYAEPNPIQFLKILPETEIVFQFKNLSDADLDLVKRILVDQGVGAKGNVGYGQLYDPKESASDDKKTAANAEPKLPIVDKNALPDDKMNTNDYERIDGKWQFIGKLKNGVILQATCTKKDLMNTKRKEFKIYIKGNEQTVWSSYSDDDVVGNDCLIITKNVPRKSTKVVAIEVLREL